MFPDGFHIKFQYVGCWVSPIVTSWSQLLAVCSTAITLHGEQQAGPIVEEGGSIPDSGFWLGLGRAADLLPLP